MKRTDLINEALRRNDTQGRIIAAFAASEVPEAYTAFVRRARREPGTDAATREGLAIVIAALITITDPHPADFLKQVRNLL